MLEITSTLQNVNKPVSVVHVKGRIDSSNYQTFQSEVENIIAQGGKYLLLDLKDTIYMSSAGLRVIHTIFNQLRELHKDANDEELRKKMNSGTYKSPYIKIANMTQEIKELFEISGFETYIESFDDIEKAISTF